jgi:hypothetical protein
MNAAYSVVAYYELWNQMSDNGASASNGSAYRASTHGLAPSWSNPARAVIQASAIVARLAYLCAVRISVLVLSMPKSGWRKILPARPSDTTEINTPTPHQEWVDLRW